MYTGRVAANRRSEGSPRHELWCGAWDFDYRCIAEGVVCSTSRPFGHDIPNPIGTTHESHHRPRRRQGRARRRPGARLAAAPHGTAHAEPVPVIEEDSPHWECRTMGNLVCGPDNAQGVTPGDYSNPNRWPGAIYCPPVGTPVDVTTGEMS